MSKVMVTDIDVPKYEKMLKDEWAKFGNDKRTCGYRPFKYKYGEPHIINDPSLSMAVNGEELIVSPFFPHMLLDEVGGDEKALRKLIGNTFEHEMMHDQYGHLVAFDGYKTDGKRVWDLINISADLAINSILVKDGQKLPKGYCVPGQDDFKDIPLGLDALQYFEKVVELYKDKGNIPDPPEQPEQSEDGEPKESKDGEGDGESQESKDGQGEPKESQESKGESKESQDGKGEPKESQDGKGQPSQSQGQPSQGQGQPSQSQGQPSQGQGQSQGEGSEGSESSQPSQGGGKGKPSGKNHSVDTSSVDDSAKESKAQKDFRERNSENSKKSGGVIEIDEQGVKNAKSQGKGTEQAGKDAHDAQGAKAEKLKKVEEAAKNKGKGEEPDDNGVSEDMCVHHGIQKGRGDSGDASSASKVAGLIPSCLRWDKILEDIIFKSKDEEDRSYATPHMIKSNAFSEFTNGVMYPHGKVENIPEILMIVDCSGSMSDYYKICFSEIGSILDTYCNSASVRLISFDTGPLTEHLFIKGMPASTRTLKSVLKPGDYLKYDANASVKDKSNQVFVLQNNDSFATLMKDFNGLRSGGGTAPSSTFDLVDAFRPQFSKVILLSDFQFDSSDIERLRGFDYRKWIFLYLYYYSQSAGPDTRYTEPSYCVNQKGLYHLDAPNLKKHYGL